MGNVYLKGQTQTSHKGDRIRCSIQVRSAILPTQRPGLITRGSPPSGRRDRLQPLALVPRASVGSPNVADLRHREAGRSFEPNVHATVPPRNMKRLFHHKATSPNTDTSLRRPGVTRVRSLFLACAVFASLAGMAPGLARAADPFVCDNVPGGTGYCNIVITPTIVFRTPAASIDFAPDRQSFDIDDDVTLKTPVGDLTLVGQLHFEYTEAGAEFPLEVTGIVRAPLADLPLFADATLRFQPMAMIGIASRDTVRQLLEGGGERLPLAENYV